MVPGLGIRCVDDRPWVTGAETCELVLALDVVGDPRARTVFADMQHLEDPFTLTIYREVRPGAGNGRIVYEVDVADAWEQVESKRLFRHLLGFWPPDNMRGVYVSGDSMEPGLEDGQLVLYEPVDHMMSGQRYVMLIEDPHTGDWPLYVKRVQLFAGGGIKIISDNRALGLEDEILIPDKDGHLIHQQTKLPVRIRVVGRVLWPTDQSADAVKLITRTIERMSAMGLQLSR